jgi:hypothetical protein
VARNSGKKCCRFRPLVLWILEAWSQSDNVVARIKTPSFFTSVSSATKRQSGLTSHPVLWFHAFRGFHKPIVETFSSFPDSFLIMEPDIVLTLLKWVCLSLTGL